MLQDGDAYVQGWGVRGYKGSKVRLLCNNVFATDSDMTADDGTHLLASDVIQENDLVKATDGELRGNMRFLADRSDRPTPYCYSKPLG